MNLRKALQTTLLGFYGILGCREPSPGMASLYVETLMPEKMAFLIEMDGRCRVEYTRSLSPHKDPRASWMIHAFGKITQTTNIPCAVAYSPKHDFAVVRGAAKRSYFFIAAAAKTLWLAEAKRHISQGHEVIVFAPNLTVISNSPSSTKMRVFIPGSFPPTTPNHKKEKDIRVIRARTYFDIAGYEATGREIYFFADPANNTG